MPLVIDIATVSAVHDKRTRSGTVHKYDKWAPEFPVEWMFEKEFAKDLELTPPMPIVDLVHLSVCDSAMFDSPRRQVTTARYNASLYAL